MRSPDNKSTLIAACWWRRASVRMRVLAWDCYFWIAAVQLTTTVSGVTPECWGLAISSGTAARLPFGHRLGQREPRIVMDPDSGLTLQVDAPSRQCCFDAPQPSPHGGTSIFPTA